MTIDDILQSPESRRAIEALAKAHGLKVDQLDGVLDHVVPALTKRIERNTLSRGGIADLLAELAQPGHARTLDPAHVARPEATEAGAGALDQIFGSIGSKDQSRSLAYQAAASSGISAELIQKLLPIIASLVMAALSKGAQGGLGDILKKLPDLTGAGPTGTNTDPHTRRAPSHQPRDDDGGDRDSGDRDDGASGNGPAEAGDSASASRRQRNGTAPAPQPVPRGTTGNAPFGGGPLPIPGDKIPGVNAPADDYARLPDVIRRGQASVEGAPLGGAVRDVLGSVLGFQSKGFLGWLIRLIVLRWGRGLLQRVLSRGLTGR